MKSIKESASCFGVICRQYKESEKLLFNEYCDVKNLQDRSTACKMMEFYMQELNIDISKLHIVHVAGSKGKGSTCAYVDSALRRYGYTTGRQGTLFLKGRFVHFSPYPVYL